MKTRNVCFLPLVFALLAILPAAAQTVTGRLIGSVQDSSQAAVPNVQITITNEATGLAIKTSTDVRGDYIASALPLGSYTIRVQAQVFRVATSAGNGVTVAQTVRVGFTSQVGTLSATEQRTAAAP